MNYYAEIESFFAAGRDAPENSECPYPAGTDADHWWTRGFAYSSRLLRAVRAESELAMLKAQIDARGEE